MKKVSATGSAAASRRGWARRSAFVAAGAALALTVSGTLSTAAAATYWKFENVAEYGMCLTGEPSGNVWISRCDTDNGGRQQWDFLSSSGDYSRIQNRATGECLTTDNETATNSVWLSSCGGLGQLWHYEAENGTIRQMSYGTYLRTSPVSQDVHTSSLGSNPEIDNRHYEWRGTHD
ncbi:RICIN domain-containing protein [Streptomyces sp. 8K308]|uniref:RICIN domain-containing protein n=1 Tax=Streptomyces sp. 8K308 TaxID=2530388 RepID=UPI001FB74410|nr:RICIN domain-containing protein [Streptomyces sp. 8K308]